MGSGCGVVAFDHSGPQVHPLTMVTLGCKYRQRTGACTCDNPPIGCCEPHERPDRRPKPPTPPTPPTPPPPLPTDFSLTGSSSLKARWRTYDRDRNMHAAATATHACMHACSTKHPLLVETPPPRSRFATFTKGKRTITQILLYSKLLKNRRNASSTLSVWKLLPHPLLPHPHPHTQVEDLHARKACF